MVDYPNPQFTFYDSKFPEATVTINFPTSIVAIRHAILMEATHVVTEEGKLIYQKNYTRPWNLLARL